MGTMKDALRAALQAASQTSESSAVNTGNTERVGETKSTATTLVADARQPAEAKTRTSESKVIITSSNNKRGKSTFRAITVDYGSTIRHEKKTSRNAKESIIAARAPTINIALMSDASAPNPTRRLVPAKRTNQSFKPIPGCLIEFSNEAICVLRNYDAPRCSLLADFEITGIAEQCHRGKITEEREIALGLDFGTSSVKVVIGDAALNKSFAVPFCEAAGLAAYLLPSCVHEVNSTFTLDYGGIVHRDLKLRFLAYPEDEIQRDRVTAFLALVIRRARGWLFTQHKGIYQGVQLLWKLSVGMPAAHSLDHALQRKLKTVAIAAWAVAGFPGPVTESKVRSAFAALPNVAAQPETAEVAVIPEIAAQIYGFVVSHSFDKHATNNYLMVDIGAGTIDSSLFRVRQTKGRRYDFDFYTSVVKPHGVANLHRHRIDWWKRTLQRQGDPAGLIPDLLSGWLDTDRIEPVPETFGDYFQGVRASFPTDERTPDDDFFINRVLAQIQGTTLWRAWKDGFLDKGDLAKVPFFLCGGGARMKYYSALESKLQSAPGYSWLSVEPWQMNKPGDLEADEISTDDYDRISVAYGLSRLEIGRVVRALPKPKQPVEDVKTWRDNYVDKDQC